MFDDLDWTYADSPTLRSTEAVSNMPEEERTTSQVRRVYELLVKPHPAYSEFVEDDGWAYARKLEFTPTSAIAPIRTEVVYREKEVGIGAALLNIVRALKPNR